MIPPVPVRRRTVLGAGAAVPAAGVLAACTGGEPTLVLVNTGLGLFQGREAYLTVAEQFGFFREEGIEVEMLPGEGTEFNLTQLAAGQVDIATIDINAGMIEYAKGTFTEFVLACVLHANHLGCIMVPESSGIARPRGLAGTVMAVIPGGTNTLVSSLNQVPDPEVLAKARTRRWSVAEKVRICSAAAIHALSTRPVRGSPMVSRSASRH